ncbi:response regulator transcription factor [Geminocystis herdmanii]|uniref:response regulator transcription factor n=1 Tax=Geminocystis herdmanii TaxID=669359 RepID=UPI00034DBE46|nr:response regulator [Geminocystis herdmanii]
MTKILIVEDEKEIRENIAQILQLNDYETISADNGKNALDLAIKYLPDLIISDIMMPYMDGYEFLENLRKTEKISIIPCILVTAKVEKKDIRQGMELGADDYLTKPFTPEELLNSVISRLARHQHITETFDVQLEKNQEVITKIKKNVNEKNKRLKTHENLINLKDDILEKLIINLSNPLNNMNIAIKMLRESDNEEKQQLYLQILQDECAKEIEILNDTKELCKILTTENIKVLQKFNLLKP